MFQVAIVKTKERRETYPNDTLREREPITRQKRRTKFSAERAKRRMSYQDQHLASKLLKNDFMFYSKICLVYYTVIKKQSKNL